MIKFRTLAVFVVVFCVMMISLTGCNAVRGAYNNYDYRAHKVDERTKYSLKKQVEDTCRSMVASYKSDKLVYEQYKDSDDAEKRSWAEQAKMRANRTAASYNEYILKNTYVFEGNVPEDICMELTYL